MKDKKIDNLVKSFEEFVDSLSKKKLDFLIKKLEKLKDSKVFIVSDNARLIFGPIPIKNKMKKGIRNKKVL